MHPCRFQRISGYTRLGRKVLVADLCLALALLCMLFGPQCTVSFGKMPRLGIHLAAWHFVCHGRQNSLLLTFSCGDGRSPHVSLVHGRPRVPVLQVASTCVYLVKCAHETKHVLGLRGRSFHSHAKVKTVQPGTILGPLALREYGALR